MGASRGLASLMASLIRTSSEVCARTVGSLHGPCVVWARVRRVFEDTPTRQRPPETQERLSFTTENTEGTEKKKELTSVISVSSVVTNTFLPSVVVSGRDKERRGCRSADLPPLLRRTP